MPKKILISSSLKNLDHIKYAVSELKKYGLSPLFPNIDYSPETGGKAITVEEKMRLAKDHFDGIEEADAAYFILKEGYMGTSCKLELGYAIAMKKPIYFSEPTSDIGLDGYVKKFIALTDLDTFRDERM